MTVPPSSPPPPAMADAPLSALATTRWTLEPSESRIEFTVRQFWGLSTVEGRFGRCEGELEFGADVAGHGELRIDAASVHTGNRRRDRHLRASDYFDCDHHPLIRYVAAAVAAPDGGLELTGELEAAGEVIALNLLAAVETGEDRLELTATAEVDARELGMSWSPVAKLRTPATLAVCACLRRVN